MHADEVRLKELLEKSKELSRQLVEVHRQIEEHRRAIPGDFVPPPVAPGGAGDKGEAQEKVEDEGQ